MALRAGWLKKKSQIFAGKLTKPDSEDPDTVNHLNWYLSTTALPGPIRARARFAPPANSRSPLPPPLTWTSKPRSSWAALNRRGEGPQRDNPSLE